MKFLAKSDSETEIVILTELEKGGNEELPGSGYQFQLCRS